MHHGQPPAIEDSYVASIGHVIEPAIRPMGFDWKIGVGLVSSIAAREGIIATLGTLYGSIRKSTLWTCKRLCAANSRSEGR